MSDPFYSPKLRLTWAKKDITDLKRKRDRFNDNNRRSRVIEINPNSFAKEYKVKPAGNSVLESFSKHTTSAIANLRCSLDHATYAAARCSGKISPKHAYFPFGDDADGFEQTIGGGRCKDIPKEILAIVRTFKPYKTGNALLWAINRIANNDKHVIVTLVIATADRLMFRGSKLKGTPTLLIPSRPIFSPNNEIIYAVASPEIGTDYDVHLLFDIAFGETGVDIVSDQSAISILDEMSRMVERILMTIEAETRRLFPGAL